MKSFSDRYTILNEAQKRAVDLVEGSVLVVAGPGSGKTEILTLRVANILKQTDAEPGEILCLTFTESAAATMRARLIELIGSDAYHIPIFTFHGFAAHIAERHPLFFHGGAQLVPASNVIQQEILAEVLTDLPLDNPLRSEHPSQGFIYLRDIRSRISDLKRAGITPKQLHEVPRHNKKRIEAITKLLEPFNARIALKNLESYRETAETLLAKKEATFPLPFFGPLSHALGQSLLLAVIQAD